MGRVLVTGATGFVGSALVKKLVRQGRDVRITVRRGSDRRNIQGLAVEEIEADLQDIAGLRRAMKGVTELYHVAGLYRTWMGDYDQLRRTNVQGTEHVLKAAMEEGVRKVVHTSSIAALGVRTDGKPSDENTLFNLQHLRLPYEQSKYEAEVVATGYATRGLPLVIVRPAMVMGRGDIYPTPSGKLVLDVLKKRIPSYFDGAIDIVDVDDVADGHMLAMEKGVPGESYNLGCSGNFVTLKHLFGLIAETGRVKPPPVRVPRSGALAWAYALTVCSDWITRREPIATPANIRALSLKKQVDFRKACEHLQVPQTALTEIIRKTVRYYKEQGYV
jgi:dihydroflavonol-4-reductase